MAAGRGILGAMIDPVATLEERVRSHPDNLRMLRFLGVTDADALRPWSGCGFDEGGVELLERRAARLPPSAKYSLCLANVVVHPDTAVIVAAHIGRYTFLLRGKRPRDATRRFDETLDGTIDLGDLEAAWNTFFADDDDDDEDHDRTVLERAYDAAGPSTASAATRS